MNRKLMLMTVAIIATATAQAQYVTYNHDSPKQNQITVMETGAGSLTPELYYWALHNKYKKSAAAKNKLGFRTTAGINLYNQTDEAESIDSALVSRAKIEALNVADRQADIAWLAEGDKINGQMGKDEAVTSTVSFLREVPRRTGNAGRNTTMFSSAPLMLPGMHICRMRSGRKSICESTTTWCSRMRFLSAISPNGRMPP